MFKLNKDEKKMVDLTIRPFLIFSIAITSLISIGSYYGTLSESEITGIIKAYLVNFLVFYMNTSWIEMKENIKRDKEKEDASANSV